MTKYLQSSKKICTSNLSFKFPAKEACVFCLEDHDAMMFFYDLFFILRDLFLFVYSNYKSVTDLHTSRSRRFSDLGQLFILPDKNKPIF